jgi:hypothetical protein
MPKTVLQDYFVLILSSFLLFFFDVPYVQASVQAFSLKRVLNIRPMLPIHAQRIAMHPQAAFRACFFSRLPDSFPSESTCVKS